MLDRTLPGIQNLKHVVVLMMENRSFDHMLGALHSVNPAIDGLTGAESNLDTTGEPVKVTPNAAFQSQLDPDPDHHFPAVDLQIFGGVTTAQNPNRQPNMKGFVQSYYNQQHNVGHSHQIMNFFTPDKLPVITTLAKQYAVFNRWFSSIPGPTLCNRAFAHYGTSFGQVSLDVFYWNKSLDYLAQLQEYVAAGSSQYSFRRWNGDFNHQIPLYAFFPKKLAQKYYQNRAGAFVYNGPDDCTGTNANRNISTTRAAAAKPVPAVPCPIISTAEKLEGSITLRAFLSESIAGSGSVVPFYFSPTIGGSDINSNAMLASYPDYRFRGPDLILFRGSIEHSIGKLPIGGFFSVDGGKIALRRDDVNLDQLRHSFNVGLTVRAGGLPVFYLLFAWGGNEGNHTTATISPTLLGGSARPSLF